MKKFICLTELFNSYECTDPSRKSNKVVSRRKVVLDVSTIFMLKENKQVSERNYAFIEEAKTEIHLVIERTNTLDIDGRKSQTNTYPITILVEEDIETVVNAMGIWV